MYANEAANISTGRSANGNQSRRIAGKEASAIGVLSTCEGVKDVLSRYLSDLHARYTGSFVVIAEPF